MKRKNIIRTLTGLLLGGAAALTFVFATHAATTTINPAIAMEDTPPLREGSLGGYAEVVEKIAPGVVSVFAKKKTRNLQVRNLDDQAKLFADPRLRRFFGDLLPDFPKLQNPLPFTPDPRGLGSGVILTPDGYIVTNNHVIEGADEVVVTLTEKGDEFPAEVVGADPQTDLAVLKIDATDLPAVTLGDSSQLAAGDIVLAIGNPFGLSKTVTSGIVSAIGRSDLNITGYENFIQTDASINPGNSGGALVDNRGRVVGINTAILSRTGNNVGIGFAIPSNMTIQIVEKLLENGTIERGFLGVFLGELTPELARAMNVKQEGVLVNDVMPDTPAEKAGMEQGDIILAMDGEPVNEMSKLRLDVGSLNPGKKTIFKICRDGSERKLKVTIGTMPSKGIASNTVPEGGPADAQDADIIDGVTLAEVVGLSAAERRRLGLPQQAQGLLVTRVAPDSSAAEAGLRPGSMITEISGEMVKNLEDAKVAAGKANNATVLLRLATPKGNRYLAIPIG